MNYQITHKTTYRYSDMASLCQNLAHLTPRQVPRQKCRKSVLSISPEPAVRAELVDSFGNCATFFSLQIPHRELTVTATHWIEVAPMGPIDLNASPPWEQVRDGLANARGTEGLDACQYVYGSRLALPDGSLAAYARQSFQPNRPLVAAAAELMGRINRDFPYDTKATSVSTPAQEVFARRRGVCQDFAHVQIACMRALGLAARYVSGYLATKPPPGKQRMVGVDATHAWLQAYCPRQGWLNLDPTNDLITSDRHVIVGWGRDYDDVSPIKGVILGGGSHVIIATVDVMDLPDGAEPPGGKAA